MALYRGDSVSAAKLLALTAEPELVRAFATKLLQVSDKPEPDDVLRELSNGRWRVLQLVKDEAGE